MLILTARVNDKIFINVEGKDIEVMVTAIKGCQVQIGFRAQSDVKIEREKVREKIKHQEDLEWLKNK